MDEKKWPEGIELNLCMKHNELEIASMTPEQLKTQSFPQSDGASYKNEHIDRKHSTVEKNLEDEHIGKTQFSTHPDDNIINTYCDTDDNIGKTNSSFLAEECIPSKFHDTESDINSDEELEIIDQDSENEEIQLLIDQRDVDYSFLASSWKVMHSMVMKVLALLPTEKC